LRFYIKFDIKETAKHATLKTTLRLLPDDIKDPIKGSIDNSRRLLSSPRNCSTWKAFIDCWSLWRPLGSLHSTPSL